MASPAVTELPDGYKDPLSSIDANHHGAGIHICNGFGLTVIIITLAIRAYIRTRVAPPWTYDDHTLAAATILAIIQCALTFAEVHDGFGTSMDLIKSDKLLTVQKVKVQKQRTPDNANFKVVGIRSRLFLHPHDLHWQDLRRSAIQTNCS